MSDVRAVSLLVLPLVLLSACKALSGDREPDASWAEGELSAPSDRVLWKLALLSVEEMDFPLAGGLDPSGGEITSGWKTNLQPFGRRGYRTRAMIEMEPTAPGLWAVKARVQKQINEAMVAPLDPQRAEWKWAPDDEVQAAILLHRISVLLSPDLPLTGEEDEVEAFLEHIDQLDEDS